MAGDFPYTNRQRRWWFATLAEEDAQVADNADRRKAQTSEMTRKADEAAEEFKPGLVCPECGGAKAERARRCFKCQTITTKAYVRRKIAGEAGPSYFGYRADGTSRTFSTMKEAAEWAGVK
jgi:hypothetical protein